MKFTILILVSIITNRKVLSQTVYGAECSSPIKCVNSTTFSFCTVIDGEEKLVGFQHCLEGQRCSEASNFQPCIYDSTPIDTVSSTSTTKTTTNAPRTTASQPNCEQKGPGIFPAPKCNQYYKCSKTLWWCDCKLKTCQKMTAFNEAAKKCVASNQTSCEFVV
ncbi:uncharacterized protein LOC123308267 [Coccinella septempunctata]|uniref:uncharacterized protein LOC123308267 n=1 Tax=Coccinella septempunctata TaxID=41139 RepID=UPI001D08A4D7|nr:uncharacterized protein LOC123308267 [Coccinella septempunctata]